MRRTIAAIVGVLAVAGITLMAGTAFAADGSTPDPAPTKDHKAPVTMHLTCTQADTTITCTWDAAAGATGYKIGEAVKHGHRGAVQVKKTTDTTATFEAKTAGHYHFVVHAVDADGKVVARSNRANVKVAKGSPADTTPTTAAAG